MTRIFHALFALTLLLFPVSSFAADLDTAITGYIHQLVEVLPPGHYDAVPFQRRFGFGIRGPWGWGYYPVKGQIAHLLVEHGNTNGMESYGVSLSTLDSSGIPIREHASLEMTNYLPDYTRVLDFTRSHNSLSMVMAETGPSPTNEAELTVQFNEQGFTEIRLKSNKSNGNSGDIICRSIVTRPVTRCSDIAE